MKTTLFYFTGTGNSLATARAISSGLGNCELKSIVKAMREKEYSVSSSKVGFIFPLYYVGIPKIVQEYVKQIELHKTQYIFIVVTKGWPVVGGAINQMKQLLKAKNKKLNAGMYIQLPMNDITMVTVAKPDTQKKLLSKAPKQIAGMVKIIHAAKNHFDPEMLGFLWPVRNIPFIERVNRDDKYFAADSHCNGCGICEKICPMNNISLVDGKPEWSGKCEQCLACYHFCPQKAISFNKRGNGIQYHHPDIKLVDLLGQK
jgi:ferredoxin/flavodoxin